MKKTLGSLVAIAIIILVTWQVQAHYYPTIRNVVETDTVFVDREFEVEKIVERTLPPKTVIRYKTKIDTVESVKLVTDTVYVSTPDAQYSYHTSFLTQYPTAHKFLGLVQKQGQLELTTLSPNGITDTNIWNVGDRNYEVGVNTALRTSQKAFSSSYQASAGWIQWADEGSVYLEFSSDMRILSVPIQATININKQPFITTGVTYEF